ncbi:hypothetical protein P152DRAFT_420899 [Eremomyces bilateralis CBS 781.70]|uniref:Peroxisome assembly protein 12 n=1 Tax=Eremomyces bilateralis CBS 781.70 TaxID=1392243 RepID=A0A6G1FWZ6_9PEZI|nr:uncharacterized protein P152DRAFT_420899 [Eremomyces bilateralis CBS 781.70]KAF1810367.1 hypothetical protein P152DRAFT_420899 [Eremomyces bilateralis CBS 781.70]
MEFMSNLQNGFDDQKPSLFEIISEEQLSSLLPPSLRYLLAVATHRHPRYLLRILNSFDELYALLMLLIERHYLKVYGGGFTENFYNLKRERVLRIKGGEVPRAQVRAAGHVREALKLKEVDVWKNLAIMVGLPYIKRKLDASYDVHAAHSSLLGSNYRRDDLPPNATVRQRFMFYYKWFLRKVYPSINAAYYFAIIAFNLAYLFDGTKYSSPFLWLIGTRVRRLGEADHKAIELLTNPPLQPPKGARPGQNSSMFNPRVMAGAIYPRILSSLRILLPTSIFALKFLEWWHASDFARQLTRKASEGLELPPPVVASLPSPPKVTLSPTDPSHPEPEKSLPGSTETESRSPPISTTTLLPILTVPAPTKETNSDCPICGNAIVNPTVSPSGYVFCYVCVHKWVEGTHERQEAFMEGGGGEEGWGAEEGSREGRWESGKGRCAVTAMKLLGGTEVLRRVII